MTLTRFVNTCSLIRFLSWPTDLNVFGQLKELTLTANKISAFADMSGLRSLDTLYLIGNKLTAIGADILYAPPVVVDH
jgi:Leucine-rich repeat (LRR) protein